MTKECARRSSCGPRVGGTNSSSSSTSASGGVRFSESPAWERDDTHDWCRTRTGNQEDVFAVAADAKACRASGLLQQNVEYQIDCHGEEEQEEGVNDYGFDDEDNEEQRDEASGWLDDNLDLLEDDEQQQQQRERHHHQQNDVPTALEALLDLELDVHNLPALEDNQFALQEQCGAFGDNDILSLEVLALQSPHGKRQQWDDKNPLEKLYAPEELSPRKVKRHLHQSLVGADVPVLTSPSHHVAPFQPSPWHSADGDEYDLASPVGLPDTPNASQGSSASRWDQVPDLRYEVDDAFFESAPPPPPSSIRTPSRSVAKKTERNSFRRTPRVSPTRRMTVHTPARALPIVPGATGPVSHQSQAQPQYQQQPASIPKRKVKHGGIYSLLLKNCGPGDHEPVLIDEKRSPEVPEEIPATCASHCWQSPARKHLSNAATVPKRKLSFIFAADHDMLINDEKLDSVEYQV